MKQTKLRKRRVIRYAILYFFLLLVFLILIVGPIVAGKMIDLGLKNLPLDILQPTGFSNNDTSASTTGKCLHDPCPEYQGGAAGGGGGETGAANTDAAAATTDAAARFRRYMAY
jgi:1,3-beta-glucan synthase